MTTYGILVVDPAWGDQTSAALDKATVQHHRGDFARGTRALIYVKDPVDAIVAEAAVSGDLIETDSAPPDLATAPSVAFSVNTERGLNVTSASENPPDPMQGRQEFGVNYLVPLEVTRPKLLTIPIPLNRIRALFGDAFAVYDEEWLPLKEADYHKLIGEWEAH